MTATYVKTSSGAQEIENRSGALTPKERRVLIVIDGKRSLEEVQAMTMAEDLAHTLAKLEEAGFIAAVGGGGSGSGGAATRESSAPATEVTFRKLPESLDSKDLEMAKNFIINTLKTFCGPMSHLTIVEATFSASTHEQVRAQYAAWREAISESWNGRRNLEDLSKQLLKVI